MRIPQRTLHMVFFVSAALFVCQLPFYPNPIGAVIKTVPALSLSLLAHVVYIIGFAIGVKAQRSRIPAAPLVMAYSLAVALLL